MYCCKEEPRISDNYYTNIPKEITPPVIPKLVTCERKLDSGGAVQSLLFPSWVSHNRSLNLYKNMKIAPRMNKSICIYLYWQPGTVKSEFALDLSRQIYQLEIAFYKAKCIWWDLYDYQNAVIWDDFMGDCCGPQNCLSYVIGILITFKLMQYKSELVVLTSNIPPLTFYMENNVCCSHYATILLDQYKHY